ncbi:helix-turn-helix transcriptional regulator [Neosynechococcus sphagnicola]|nr:helix-turn-helix domain-containing protein [Neosynechococcus sphagnicola]
MVKKLVSPLMLLRMQAGLTQSELAEALGVSDTTVRNWEKGRTVAQLTIPQIKILCKLVKKPIEDIPDSFAPQPIQGHE